MKPAGAASAAPALFCLFEKYLKEQYASAPAGAAQAGGCGHPRLRVRRRRADVGIRPYGYGAGGRDDAGRVLVRLQMKKKPGDMGCLQVLDCQKTRKASESEGRKV